MLKPYSIAIHIIGWLLFLSLPALFIISGSEGGSPTEILQHPLSWLSFLIYIFIFYFHTYWLFPKLFFRKKYVLYFLCLIILFCTVFFLRPFDALMNHSRSKPTFTEMHQRQPQNFDQGMPMPNGGPNRDHSSPRVDIISIALFFLVLALSIAMVIEKRWRIAVQQAAAAEADKANAELSFLKAQINPHFLFNTLNNIYSLAVSKNENTADAIMKLSNIMRYVTDEVNEDFVSLQNEIDAINDYISLQKMRLSKKVNVSFEVTGNTAGKQIAPLLLMPFVENVFKHGISTSEPSELLIKLVVTEKNITFLTTNKLFNTERVAERVGIGNTNTKQRLEQIYPNKYLLDISEENALFTVQLILSV